MLEPFDMKWVPSVMRGPLLRLIDSNIKIYEQVFKHADPDYAISKRAAMACLKLAESSHYHSSSIEKFTLNEVLIIRILLANESKSSLNKNLVLLGISDDAEVTWLTHGAPDKTINCPGAYATTVMQKSPYHSVVMIPKHSFDDQAEDRFRNFKRLAFMESLCV